MPDIELRVPFGQNADGRMVTVEAVPQGLACNCVCPECQTALIAVKGSGEVGQSGRRSPRHHFRHAAEPCEHGGETALHRFAKQTICENLHIELPHDVLGTMTAAFEEPPREKLEKFLKGFPYRPDVLATYDSGEHLAIEIWVAHQVPGEKTAAYNERQVAAIEIDLRHAIGIDRDEDSWKAIILKAAPRQWLCPPRVIREALAARAAAEAERRRELELAQERARVVEAERRRVEAEREARRRQAEIEWREKQERARQREAEAERERQQERERIAEIERQKRLREEDDRRQQAEKAAAEYQRVENEKAAIHERARKLLPPDFDERLRRFAEWSRTRWSTNDPADVEF